MLPPWLICGVLFFGGLLAVKLLLRAAALAWCFADTSMIAKKCGSESREREQCGHTGI